MQELANLLNYGDFNKMILKITKFQQNNKFSNF